ncbi:MAG: Gfo/Idh/MocA family oxidoreductase [Eubacteriales bacterium]|nr:Gfo/Idh/MocA family oxidoreductase [Eubacteriales bacterium]
MESLKVGYIGLGRMAAVMAGAMNKMKHTDCFACASRNIEKAVSFKNEYGFERAYGSYEELIDDKDVDIVYVATPHSHHKDIVEKCLKAGKPVICEKAFTVNAHEARELTELARRNNTFLAEAIWTRYMPIAKELRTLAHERIGEIESVSVNLGYRTYENKRVRLPEYSGGSLLDVGIYCLTFLSLILGDDIEDISAVMNETDTGVDGECFAMLVINDNGRKIPCRIHSSIMGPTDRRGIVYGSRGYMVVENVNNFERVDIFENSHKCIYSVNAPVQPETGYVYQFEACRHALDAGMIETDLMPHDETIRMMDIMDRIREKMNLKYPMED